jgi:hypothetical protein
LLKIEDTISRNRILKKRSYLAKDFGLGSPRARLAASPNVLAGGTPGAKKNKKDLRVTNNITISIQDYIYIV